MNNISDKIYNTIIHIKSISSSNQKLEILKNFISILDETELEVFKKFCVYTYDYHYVYNLKKIPKVKHETPDSSKDIFYMFSLFDDFDDRKLTGNAAKNALATLIKEADSISTSELSKMLINKSFDCGMSITSINKAFGFKHIVEHLVMLQEPATDKLLDKLTYPAYSQMKMDALRIEIELNDKIIMLTRGGNQITTGNNILDNEMLKLLKAYQTKYDVDRIYVDGEMMFLDKDGKHLPRKVSNGIANKCIQGTKEVINEHEVQFVVWDILTEDEKSGVVKTDYKDKYELLTELVNSLDSNVFALPETIIVHNKQEAIAIAIDYVKKGIEGSIVKEFLGHYQQKRVSYQLKLKAAREIELRVIGYNLSEDNKYDGLIGSLICASDDGKILVNISGLKDKERKQWLDNSLNGKILTVRFNEVIDNEDHPDKYSLFLPRIVETRFDKDTTDTLESALTAPFIVVN